MALKESTVAMSSSRGKTARLAVPVAAAALGALLVPGCQLIPQQAEGQCHFPPSLTLASGYVCFTTPPTVNPDGT